MEIVQLKSVNLLEVSGYQDSYVFYYMLAVLEAIK